MVSVLERAQAREIRESTPYASPCVVRVSDASCSSPGAAAPSSRACATCPWAGHSPTHLREHFHASLQWLLAAADRESRASGVFRPGVWLCVCARLVSIDYRVTEADDHTRLVIERSPHHRVVSGQLHNAQTQANRPLPHVHTTRCVLELDAPDGSAGHRE